MSRLSISKPQAEDDDEHLYFLNEIPSSLDRALNISSKAPHSHFVAIASPRGSSSSSSASSSSLSPRHPARASLATSRRYAPLFNPIKSFYRRHEAPILVITSQLFGAGMNVVTRLLENEDEGMQAFQVLFVRMFITVCGCLAWGYWAKLPDFPLGKRGMRKWLFARAATGFWGIFGMYYSLKYLPVSDAVVLTFLSPPLSLYLCHLFLHEPFSRTARFASLLCLLGVLLIARPTSFFSSLAPPLPPPPSASESATSSFIPAATPTQRLSAIFISLLGVVGGAGAFLSIRALGPNTHPVISITYFSVWCTVVSLVALTLTAPLSRHLTFLPSDLVFRLPASFRQWYLLLLLGVCGIVMQLLLTRGLAMGKNASLATNCLYVNLIFSAGLGRVVFGEVPGAWSVVGMTCIMGGVVWVAREKGVLERAGEVRFVAGDEELGVVGRNGPVEETGYARAEDLRSERCGLREERGDMEEALNGPRSSFDAEDATAVGEGEDGINARFRRGELI